MYKSIRNVQGSGSVKPSPPRPRESAQCTLDVINLEPEPVKEGEVEETETEYCAGRETWRGTRDKMRKCFGHTIQIEPRVSVLHHV